MPIRSSDSNISSAWDLVRDMRNPSNPLFYRSRCAVSKPARLTQFLALPRLPDSVSARFVPRGPMGWLQNKFEKNFMISTVDYVFNWARKSAVWPMTFGLACCAIEMIASSTARFDIARFGSEVFRPSPRQSDLMIVAGTVTLKMAPVVKRIYDQMPDPKWVISMGACSSVCGPFNTYAVLQ